MHWIDFIFGVCAGISVVFIWAILAFKAEIHPDPKPTEDQDEDGEEWKR